jgi:hypothetical protein
MDVGCIAGEENSAGAILRNLALVDAERREPDRIACLHPSRATDIEDSLYFLNRWSMAMPFTDGSSGLTGIGDRAVSRSSKGEQSEHPVSVPEDTDCGRSGHSAQMKISKNPIT